MFNHVEQLTIGGMGETSLLDTFSDDEALESKSASINLFEGEDEFLLKADLQGCREKDLDIRFGCGTLIISGSRDVFQQKRNVHLSLETDREEKFEKYIHFRVPIQTHRITALIENGTLTVYLPKGKNLRPLFRNWDRVRTPWPSPSSPPTLIQSPT